jgi:hypothetical protein
MSYIPYQLIFGGIKNIVKGYCKFNHPEAGGKMASIHRNVIDDILPEFSANLIKLGVVKLP